MVDEVYDVVDELGNKIGTATWSECHAKGLLHQCASAIVFKDSTKTETLLQKRSSNMKQHPNMWQHSAGGHLLAGMTPEEGIRAELQEELFANHELPKFEIKKIVTFLNQDIPNNNELLNLYEIIYPGPFYFDEKEVAEAPSWIGWDELIRDMKESPSKYTPVFHNIVREYTKAVSR